MSTSGEDVRQEHINKLADEIEQISKTLNKDLELIKVKINAINDAVAKSTVNEEILSEYKELNRKIQNQKDEINKRINVLQDQDGVIGLSSEELKKLEASRAQSKEWEEFAKLSKHGEKRNVILPAPEFTEAAKRLLTTQTLPPPKPAVPITPPQQTPKVVAKVPNTISKWDKENQKILFLNMEKSIKFAGNNYNEFKDIQIDITSKEDKTMTVKSTKGDKIDFTVSSQNGSDNISGKVTDENLTAMSIAIISNLKTKLSVNSDAHLSINLNNCKPSEVAIKFQEKINIERERVILELQNSKDPNKKEECEQIDKLVEKLKNVTFKTPEISTAKVTLEDSQQAKQKDTTGAKKRPNSEPETPSHTNTTTSDTRERSNSFRF